jgi:NAD-dependent deacetylase
MPPEPWAAAESAVRDADLLLVIGTSAVVYPAAYLPAIAFERSIPVVVINPLKTEHSGLVGAVHVPASAAQALPILTNMLFGA